MLLGFIIISLITDILCTCQDTSTFALQILGKNSELIRSSLHSMHHTKTENPHILDNIGDHQAHDDGGYEPGEHARAD